MSIEYNVFVDWFNSIKAGSKISPHSLKDLQEAGFTVIPNLVESTDLAKITKSYDLVVKSAVSDDVRTGSSTTRINDFVNRGSDFDALYICPPLLEACCHIIGQPFKLSSFHARSLHPKSPAQKLHIDFKPNEKTFPLVGFIFMIDGFNKENGATRFVPGSHNWPIKPDELAVDALANYESQIQTACGQAGSLIIFNGSVWHGHLVNLTNKPRRSLQGAFIPRTVQSAIDFKTRMQADTLTRISDLAKYILAI